MDTSSFNPCSPSSPAPNSSPKERGNGGNPLQRPARQAGSGDAVEEAVPADRAPAPAAEAKKREFPIALSKEIAEDFAVIRGSRANHARTYRRARVTSPAPARLNSSSSIYPRREIEGARRDNEIVCGDVVGLLVMGAHPGVDLTLHLQFSAMSVVVSILGAAWDIFITGSRGATIEAAFKAPRITSKKLISKENIRRLPQAHNLDLAVDDFDKEEIDHELLYSFQQNSRAYDKVCDIVKKQLTLADATAVSGSSMFQDLGMN